MKKMILVSLSAVMTALSIYFVFIWTPEKVNNDFLVEKSLEYSNKIEEKDNTVKEKEENNKITNNKEENKLDSNNKDTDKEKIDSNKGNEVQKEEPLIKEDEIQSNAVATSKIFTVNKDEIVEMLTFKDKYNLMSLLNKMSAIDIERIVTSINTKGEKEGCIEVFKILKLRLTEEDYNKVKEILSPYINIDFVESLV